MTQKDDISIITKEEYQNALTNAGLNKSDLIDLSNKKVDDLVKLAKYKKLLPNKYKNLLNELEAILETINSMI